jgi:hypothetical protein
MRLLRTIYKSDPDPAERFAKSKENVMKTIILHDARGRILSIAKVGDLKAAGSVFAKVGLVPGPGQQLAEIELSAEDENRPLRELHATYQIDTATKKLVKKLL